MARTVTTDLQLLPAVLTEAVQGAFAKKNAFFGSRLAALGIVVVNDTLTEGASKIGKYVTIPYFGTLGEFDDNNTDGDAVTTKKITSTSEQDTLCRKSNAFEVTDWAQWSGVGDPYAACADSMVASATRAMDDACITCAVASGVLTKDIYSLTTPMKLDNDVIVDARSLYWGDEADNDTMALLVHSRTKADFLKQKDSTGQPMQAIQIAPNGDMTYYGYPVVVSDKCPLTGSTMPAMTVVSGDNAPTLTGTPTGPWKLVIDLVDAGDRGAGTFRFSTDGGITWSATITITATTGVNVLTDTATDSLVGNNGATGLTATFASHSYSATDNYTSNALLKVTSLLVKPRAIAFWYNRAALALETDRDILRDSSLGAMHLYYVAHRYRRRPGGTKPGIIQITHNVTPLS